MPFFLAVKAFNVLLVFALSNLSGKSLVLGFLVGFLADHTLVIIIADELNNSSRIDRPASFVSIGSNGTDAHVVKGGKGHDEDVSILLIRHTLAHSCKLLMKISEFHEVGMYIIVIPAAHILQLLPQVNRQALRPILTNILQTVPPSHCGNTGFDPVK